MSSIQPGLLGLALFSLAALACGGSGSTGPSGGSPRDCSVMLSGGATGSAACSNVSTLWTSDDNGSVFAIAAVVGSDTVSGSVDFTGIPVDSTYNEAGGAQAFLGVNNGSTTWGAGAGIGSWSLDVTSVKAGTTGGGITSYVVHGTLHATLRTFIADTTPDVTLVGTF